MTEHHTRTPAGARVSVRGMCGDLLVPCVDEPDRAIFKRGQYRDVRMTAQPEDVLDTACLEILHELIGDEIFHDCPFPKSDLLVRHLRQRGGSVRGAGPLVGVIESLSASVP